MIKEKELLLALLIEKYGKPNEVPNSTETENPTKTRSRRTRNRVNPTNARVYGKEWVVGEDAFVKQQVLAGSSLQDIAIATGRSLGAVTIRARQHIFPEGLPR